MPPHDTREHAHDHQDHGDDLGLSLLPAVNMEGVVCLNEEVRDSGRAILKLHEERFTTNPSLRSPEGDPELLMIIPFREAVTVHSICVMNTAENSGDGTRAPPRRIKLFVDRDSIDFETARELPENVLRANASAIDLVPPSHSEETATIDYPLRPASKFQNIQSLAIFVQGNFDEEGQMGTEITYIGLKGTGTNLRRQAVEAVYETKGMKKDHKVPGGEYQAESGASI